MFKYIAAIATLSLKLRTTRSCVFYQIRRLEIQSVNRRFTLTVFCRFLLRLRIELVLCYINSWASHAGNAVRILLVSSPIKSNIYIDLWVLFSCPIMVFPTTIPTFEKMASSS